MTEDKEFLYTTCAILVFVSFMFTLAVLSPPTAYYKCLDKIEYEEAEEFDKLIGICERLR